jgi:hypothetical protein
MAVPRSDLPCSVAGCLEPRYVSPAGNARVLCRVHVNAENRSPRGLERSRQTHRRQRSTPEGRERSNRLVSESKRRTGYRAAKACARRRREAPFTWTRMEPWPETCQSPLVGMTPCAGPIQEGHEPPVSWMLRNPDYAGPLLLRPECKQHNEVEKRSTPDWLLQVDPRGPQNDRTASEATAEPEYPPVAI